MESRARQVRRERENCGEGRLHVHGADGFLASEIDLPFTFASLCRWYSSLRRARVSRAPTKSRCSCTFLGGGLLAGGGLATYGDAGRANLIAFIAHGLFGRGA